jgi:selT/selW/selH-like putative selenoprotein
MLVRIEYCGTCNYRPAAAALALAIREALGIDSRLVHSARSGAFELIVDGEVLFSKLRSGSFPSQEWILDLLRKKAGEGYAGAKR